MNTMATRRMFLFMLLILSTTFVLGIENDNDEIRNNNHNITSATKYLIYDVNPGEGFNLRRDVYIRAANLVKHLNDRGEDWVLVLPPWSHLYHWKSRYLQQIGTEWKSFFDITKLNLYVPVMEFSDFIKFNGPSIGHLLYLQRHPEGFSKGWREIIEIGDCGKEHSLYHKGEDGFFHGYFWNVENVNAKKFDCVNVQGAATVLADFLKKLDAKSVFLPRFEQVQHITYGGDEFYKARRSLVFAEHLRIEGDQFREKYLNSKDENDKTTYNADWRKQFPKENSALGGPYLGLHMRRADFAYAHKETVPSIAEIGEEVNKMLKKYKLKLIYLATDSDEKEIQELQSIVKAKIKKFPRTKEIIKTFKDGGVAIIDQWIAAHARYFIGTCVSTFSFRIQEERDILGFNPDTTFNCICGKQSPPDRCEKPTRWRVVFR